MIQQGTYATPRADLGEAFHEHSFNPGDFIADQILPVKNVRKKAATMSVITRENSKRADVKHANGAVYNRINLHTEDLEYQCTNKGLEIPLTDEDRENFADDFDAEIESTQALKKKVFTEQEIVVAEAIFNPTTWAGADLYTDVSGDPWDAAASDAIAHVLAAKEKVRRNTGVVPDSLIIGAVTLNNLLGNTGIKAQFPGAPLITLDMLIQSMPKIFGLRQLLVGMGTYDSAKEGQDASISDIWSDDYAMIFKVQQGSTIVNPGLGRIITWDRYSQFLTTVEQYREEQTESDIFRAKHFDVPKIFDKYFGHLLKID